MLQQSADKEATLADGELIATDAETPAEAAKVLEASDEEALHLEGEMIESTDNGWSEGDPQDQPDNPEPAQQP